jgi:four helix bundle suffix protein
MSNLKDENYGKNEKNGNYRRNERDVNNGNYVSNAGNRKPFNHGNASQTKQPPLKSPSHSSHTSHPSHNSHSHNPHSSPSHLSPSDSTPRILRPRGDYHTLLTYQKSQVIYEITYRFCQRFLNKGDRTIDQMVQAARSGKQNIVEGSKAGTTSKETEIKLTGVARASLEELLEDYLDFLRLRDLPVWDKQSKEAQYARKLGAAESISFETFRDFTETRPAEVVANIAICLIYQTTYLLDQQLKGLEQKFLRDGGLRERMTRARLEMRAGKKGQ